MLRLRSHRKILRRRMGGDAKDGSSDLMASGAVSSDKFAVISVSEWQASLGADERRWEVEWINKKSTELAENSAKLVNGGDLNQGSAEALQSLVLQMHVMKYNDTPRVQESVEKLKRALESAGLRQSVIDDSRKNLQLILPVDKIKLNKAVASGASAGEVKYRKAGPSEVKLLKQAVKDRLKDPASPVFGNFYIVGADKACVEVNAKNSFGGYVGMSATYLAKVDGAWYSIYDTKSNAMMCINVFAR